MEKKNKKSTNKTMWEYFRPQDIQEKVNGYGYNLDNRSLAFLCLMIFLFCIIIGYLLKLNVINIVIICISFIACLPQIIINKYKYQYEQSRFTEINSYMEQMIYSFKKKDKILSCLEDTYELASNNMRRIINKSIRYIEKGLTKKNIYREALSFIENEYSCSRLTTLHLFLVEIEENGGDYQHSLSILLEDIQQWAKRIRLQQQNRKSLQGKVLISIALAMVTCGIMLFMVPSEYTHMIVASQLYQWVTTLILIMCILLYVFANQKLTSSYLEDDTNLMSKNDFNRYYKRATRMDIKSERKKNIKIIITFILLTVVLAFVYLKFIKQFSIMAAMITCGLLAIFYYFKPLLDKNTATKNVVREIEKVFPMWIRSLILHLQTNNVTVSLYNSLATCPDALKYELATLVNEIQNNPGHIEPYLNFMKDFDGCYDIKATIKHLYALTEFGSDDLVQQLDYLVQQNQELIEHSETIQNEDKLSGLSFLILLPMLFAIAKLGVDLYLFSNSFMGYMGNF